MSVSAAAASVGRIEEVVAVLVSHLSTFDIARAQRVSRTWKYEIARSLVCQQKLFREAVPPKEYMVYRDHPTDGTKFETWMKEYASDEQRLHDTETRQLVATSSPLFAHTTPKTLDDAHHCTHVLRLAMDVEFCEEFLSLPRGSWKQMYLTQPPAQEVSIHFVYVFDDGPFRTRHVVVELPSSMYSENGLRLEHFPAKIREGLPSTDPEFWTWLPNEYHFGSVLPLDDYLATFGFPKFKGVWLEFSQLIHEEHIFVSLARARGPPHPWNPPLWVPQS